MIQPNELITHTCFQLLKEERSLHILADWKGMGMAQVFIYNPESILCGFISVGFGNFIPETYISKEITTLNARPICLQPGEYSMVTVFFPKEGEMLTEISLDISLDTDRVYEPAFSQLSKLLSSSDFDHIVQEEKRYYKGDFHGHTILSDGHNNRMEAAEIIKKQGLDFMAITEHNCLAFLSSDLPCLEIPSFELTLPSGHMNVHGIKELHLDWWKLRDTFSLEELWNQVILDYKNHANLSLNHMFLVPWQVSYENLDLASLHTIEVICDPTYPSAMEANDKAVAFLDYVWNQKIQLYGVGGSDSHNKEDEYYEGSVEPSIYGDPATYVYCDGLSVTHLIEGVKKGHSYVARYVDLSIKIQNGESLILPGDEITDLQKGISYQVTVHNLSKPLMGRFICSSNVVKEELLDTNCTSTLFTFENLKEGDWLRFGLYDLEGHVIAYVNPVFHGERHKGKALFGEIYKNFEKEYSRTYDKRDSI